MFERFASLRPHLALASGQWSQFQGTRDPKARADQSRHPARERTIVIVESDARLSEVVAEAILELVPAGDARSAYTVIAVTDGREAIALFARVQPDLVILDLQLEDMDARDVLESLQRNPRLSRVPVILTSATGVFEQVDRERATAALPKPFAIRELERAVRRALSASRELSESPR